MLNQSPIFEKKNVLVTGGAGFIGSHLCERLLREANVICMDDFSNSTVNNIDHLLQYPDFELIRYDVTQPIDLDDFIELDKFKVKYQGIQEIYHLACPTSPKNFEQLKIQSLKANSNAMISTLELATKYRAKYVFASSSVVYGPANNSQTNFKEENNGVVDQLSPRGCYDEGKRFAETCVATYRQVYGIDTKIARIFTTYGPRMRLHEGKLIPDFVLHALENKDLIIYGEENNEQTLCFITDLVDAMVRLMQSGPEVELVNIGSDEVFQMSDIARKIIQMTNSNSQISFQESLQYISKRGMPDLTRVKELLNWIPLVRLDEGLRKTIDYTIANKEAYGLNNN
jgi:UDP-glucuronate decarboxylase